MPFKTFFNWLFDDSINSEIPKPKLNEEGKVLIPDILKYNSPITHTYVISLFLNSPELNHFLNKKFNNINLRYLEKKELFLFIKKCVIDFRIKRNMMLYKPYKKQEELFKGLRSKIPLLKNDDIELLSDLCLKLPDEEKDEIYSGLGLLKEKPVKTKIKKETKKKQKNKISKDDFLKNISVIKK